MEQLFVELAMSALILFGLYLVVVMVATIADNHSKNKDSK